MMAAWHRHAARRRLSHGDAPYDAPSDASPPWVPREPATWMPDIALGTVAERRAKAAAVTARLREARGGARPAGHAWTCPCQPCVRFWSRVEESFNVVGRRQVAA